MGIFDSARRAFNEAIERRKVFLAGFLLMLTGFALTFSYFRGYFDNDRYSWILWFASVTLLMFSVRSDYAGLSGSPLKLVSPGFRKLMFFAAGVTALYFLTHLMNYSTAPWNSYGLFDDAAWDIYFVQEFTQPGASVQVAFNDLQIGRIGRELVFHYFIGIWFRLFGFNLFIFNMALIFLGYITVLFTSLLAYRIFDDLTMAAACAVLMNFYPMHFTQVFMGHRYAICAPLMMISVYFLYMGYKTHSRVKAIAGGVFAALCMSSAIMGKQYIYALAGTVVFYLIFHINKRKEIIKHAEITSLAAAGFIFAVIPLFSYILVNREIYTLRESSLIVEFFGKLKSEGSKPLWDNIRLWYQTVFAQKSFQRQFMHDYPVIHWSMLVFVVSGMILAFIRKHYYILLMIAIPSAGCFVAASYDFRLLISAPFIILAAVFSVKELSELIKNRKVRNTAVLILAAALVISPVNYLYRLSKDPNGQYLLPHRSVAASRFIQDVVVGDEDPDFLMKKDEFRRQAWNDRYDTLAATRESYAHVHAFLHDHDAYKVLDLLANFPYRGRDPELLAGYFRESVGKYENNGRDLMLVIEKGEEVSDILDLLNSFEKGSVRLHSTVIDGVKLEMFAILIENEDIADFMEYVLRG